MGRDLPICPVRFVDDDLQFGQRQRRGVPVGVNLDQVGTVPDLLPHCPSRFIDAADALGATRKRGKVGGNAERVILSNGRDRSRRDPHTRTLDETALDRIT
jgi:hypothetical protein